MARRFSYLAFCLALLGWGGCGQNIDRKDLDEPCTRTGQCLEGLVCLSGVCLEAADAGSIDLDGGT